jgi:hypothetical protein
VRRVPLRVGGRREQVELIDREHERGQTHDPKHNVQQAFHVTSSVRYAQIVNGLKDKAL